MSINWDDPAERFHLSDRVGPDEYSRLFLEHMRKSTVTTVNGYPIRPVSTRFGQLFSVDGASIAFRTQAEAEAHAKTLPSKDPA